MSPCFRRKIWKGHESPKVKEDHLLRAKCLSMTDAAFLSLEVMLAKVCKVAVEIYSTLMGYVVFSTKDRALYPLKRQSYAYTMCCSCLRCSSCNTRSRFYRSCKATGTPKMAATKFLAPLLFVFSGLLLAYHLSKSNQFIPEHLEVLPLDPFNFTFASKQPIQVGMARARGLKSDVYERDSHRNKSVLSKIFFSLLFHCGDIQLNPGPYKYPCAI